MTRQYKLHKIRANNLFLQKLIKFKGYQKIGLRGLKFYMSTRLIPSKNSPSVLKKFPSKISFFFIY